MRIKIGGLVLFLTFFLSSLLLNAQTKSFGLKLNPGLGFMRSPHLKQAAHALQSNHPGIEKYDIRSKAGFQFGIGGFFQYEINEKFTLLTDPSFNYFRSTFTQNYISDTYSSGGEDQQTTIRSTAKVHYLYANIPIMIKYELLSYQRVFVSGGFSLNINSKAKIIADEDSVTNAIASDGNIDYTTIRNISSKATADKFSPLSVNLNFGIGKSFLMGRYYNLDIELRYQFPLTSSNFYTTDQQYQSSTALNGVFGQSGKESLEAASGKTINHFRSSVISLAIRYVLWSK
ncbi:MAG TPA: outer membrane beta-barrel protein [Cytophagaceae bacterium]|nr:outer membrane beta-barrel protein [Cytophagaceae bacterium]